MAGEHYKAILRVTHIYNFLAEDKVGRTGKIEMKEANDFFYLHHTFIGNPSSVGANSNCMQ